VTFEVANADSALILVAAADATEADRMAKGQDSLDEIIITNSQELTTAVPSILVP
jgi:hypothetical protein